MSTKLLLLLLGTALSPFLVSAGETPPGFEDLLASTGQKPDDLDDKTRDLLLDHIFGGNNDNGEEEKEKEKVKLGGICGNRNECMDGLDCTFTSGITWRVCLPMNCMQAVVDDHNKASEGADMAPFDEYHHNVMAGAGISPTLFEDHMESDLLNQSTLALGKDAAKNGNFQHLIKDDVRTNLMSSLLNEQDGDPLHMQLLQHKIQDCFAPFHGLTETEVDHKDGTNTSTRKLQGSAEVATLPGFFIELSALFQFTFALGVLDVDGNRTIVNDYCLGAGPTIGTSSRSFP